MEFSSILFIFAIVIIVLAYLLKPLFGDEAQIPSSSSQELSTLMAQRDQTLESIRDWDMSFQMGKVNEEEYHPYRRMLAENGAAVLRSIDELVGTVDKDSAIVRDKANEEGAVVSVEALLEEEIQAVREGLPSGEPERVGFCTQCGTAIVEGDRFCTTCGADLVA